MTISRMQMERQLRAGGGLMTLEEPRQGYFLGKIVKKAKRAVKKVVKSPIGKIALAAAAANFAPMLLGKGTLLQQAGGFSGLPGLFARSRLGTGLASGEGMLGQLGNLFRVGGKKGADLSLFRIGGGLLGAGAIAAPFLMGGDEEEVEEETPFTETPSSIANIVEQARNQDPSLRFLPEPKFVRNFYAANGGLASFDNREPMQEGGIMDLGGMEKDYRTGGFVELGAEERADDVPARLSKNEFVFTADAVRNAGGGDIDKGAEVMQNMMDNLEAGGMISEESQGMNPAQEMFDQSQMLEGRLA
jgi:hypothetical protein